MANPAPWKEPGGNIMFRERWNSARQQNGGRKGSRRIATLAPQRDCAQHSVARLAQSEKGKEQAALNCAHTCLGRGSNFFLEHSLTWKDQTKGNAETSGTL